MFSICLYYMLFLRRQGYYDTSTAGISSSPTIVTHSTHVYPDGCAYGECSRHTSNLILFLVGIEK